MKTFLAAIDLSPVSELVVAEAAALARAADGKVILLTALGASSDAAVFGAAAKPNAKITVNHARAVRHRLAALQQALQSDFVAAESLVRRGTAAAVILSVAEEVDATCIVIGSHGHSALHDLLLGSTAQLLLKRARQPVLIIPLSMRKRRPAKMRVTRDPIEPQ